MSKRMASIIVVTFALFWVASRGAAGAPAPESIQLQPPPTEEERRQLRKSERPGWSAAMAREIEMELAGSPEPVDVERYSIDIRVDPVLQRVDGSVRIQARSLNDGLSILNVDLYDAMAVTSIDIGATPLGFTRALDRIEITLDRPYDAGELIDLTIEYGGTPPSSGEFGTSFGFDTHSGQPIIWSLSEPTGAPTWWPCIDDPADKAIVDMDLTVPQPLIAVSNGLLSEEVDNGDFTTTFRWRSDYLISTYLVSVAISNYATFTDEYQPVTGGPPMLVQHWIYPEEPLRSRAQEDLNVTVPMLTFFSGLLGEYPFVDEKYGHAIFSWGGSMEHQTVTSHGTVWLRGDHHFDWVVAHELGHQWFGDSTSPAAWAEIWLNEGFATYCEALWQENLGGAAALHQWMDTIDYPSFCGTVYDPTASGCGLFGSTVYDKGGWVLHMLRHVIGDAAFFQGMRDYVAAFAYSNATTPEFRAVMEAASGQDLTAFFDQWVYRGGHPVYRWGWSAVETAAGWVTYVRIEQTQTEPPFQMPIDLVIDGPGGPSTFVLQNAAAAEDFALPPLPQEPTGVTFDPDNWVLNQVETGSPILLPDGDLDGVPDTADNCPLTQNPEQEDLDADGEGDACDVDSDGDGRINVDDCAPTDPNIQDPPPEVAGLSVAGSPSTLLTWTALAGGPDGVTYDLVRGDLPDLRIDFGTSGAACTATGLTLPEATDVDQPVAGYGFYYLVRGRNVCGPGSLGDGRGGPPRHNVLCP